MEKMEKDEFKELMRQAKVEEEVDALMKETEGVEDPDEVKPKRPRRPRKAAEKPRKKPGPKPGNKRQPCKKAQEAADQKTDEEDVTQKQEEALKAMCSLTTGYTQQLIKEAEKNLKTADKLADMALIYSGYIETVEEMLK